MAFSMASCQASCDGCFMRRYACPGFERLSPWFKVFLACILNLLSGGVVYGWSALQQVYKDENVSDSLCAANDTLRPCPQQDFYLGLVFSIASTGNIILMLLVWMPVLFCVVVDVPLLALPLLVWVPVLPCVVCAGLPMGVLVDLAGPRIAFFVSEVFVVVGAVLLGFGDVLPFVYIPAFLLLGIGGTGVQVSLMHTSGLFPKNKSNVTNAIHACFQLSFLIFALFQAIYDSDPAGVSSSDMFLCYSAVALLCLVAGLFWPARAYGGGHGHDHGRATSTRSAAPSIVLPRGSFHNRGVAGLRAAASGATTYGADDDSGAEARKAALMADDPEDSPHHPADYHLHEGAGASGDNNEDGENGDLLDADSMVVVNTMGVMTDRSVAGNQQRLVSKSIAARSAAPSLHVKPEFDPITATFKQQILAGHLWACVFFITIGIVFSNAFIATLGQNLGQKCVQSNITSPAEIGAKINSMVSVFTILTSLAVVCLPALGLVMDRLGTASGALFVATLNLMYSGSALIPGIDIQVLTFVLYAIGRTFTFSYLFAFVNIEFGLKYFGLLCGIIMFFAGLMNLLLNVITGLITSGDLTILDVQYMQLAVYVVSFYFPIYLFAKKGCKLNCGAKKQPTFNRYTSSSAHLDKGPHTGGDDHVDADLTAML